MSSLLKPFLLTSIIIGIVPANLRSSEAKPEAETYLYPMDFAPHEESAAEIAEREKKLEELSKANFQKLDAMVSNPDRKELDAYIKSKSPSHLLLLANEYGYTALKEPALQRIRQSYAKNLAAASKTLSVRGIADIGDVYAFRSALDDAVMLKDAGQFTPEMSAPLEELITKYVEGKGGFTGFSRKFPFFLSGYNKEAIIMDVASSTKLLYQGTGKFPRTIDAFDAAWAQLTRNGYELDNAPHYDTSVNMPIILRWAIRHNRVDDLRNSPHFRMIFDRIGRMILSNGECANYGKSMTSMGKGTKDGVAYDDYRVGGGLGFAADLRWAYRFYGDPTYLYLARKYEMTNTDGKGHLTSMPKAQDLNFFNVRGAAYSKDYPLSYTTMRLKGRGPYLDRGIRRDGIMPIQDKLILSTGSHPRSPSMLMDMSYSQSKVKINRRMGIDNLMFNGTHLISIVWRPDEAERTNRIIIAPADKPYPGTGKAAVAKSDKEDDKEEKDTDKPAEGPTDAPSSSSPDSSVNTASGAKPEKIGYVMADYFATRINENLAYGEVEYSQLQYEGIHARRRMALLNNGVMVVDDTIWTDPSYKGGKNAGSLYNLWTQIVAKGANWVLTNPKKGHLPEGGTGLTQVLVYFAPAPELKIGLLDKVFHCSTLLKPDGKVHIVSAIIPIPQQKSAASGPTVGDGIKTRTDASGTTTVDIPYAPGQTLSVTFPGGREGLADYRIDGKGAPSKPASLPARNAKVRTPYSVAFGNFSEFYLPNFKAEFEMNENRFRSFWIGGRELERVRDYNTLGNVLTFSPEFLKSLIDAKTRTDLTVKFTSGNDVVLRLNGDTTPGVKVSNARRSKTYINDEMFFPDGFRENNKVEAVGGNYSLTFYDDFLFRGKPTVIEVKNGQSVKLTNPLFRSMKIKKLP